MLLVGTAVGVGAGAVILISHSKQRKQIEHDCQLNINSKTELLNKLFAEYGKLGQIYAEYDAYQERIGQELEKY